MSNAPVPISEVEPTTITEVENALMVLRKVVAEVGSMPPGVEKARVVSCLYRAFQEQTKEVREMREVALLDAAMDLAREDFGDDAVFFPKMEEGERYLYYIDRGLKKMYRLNRHIEIQRGDGTSMILDPFSNDYEAARIAERMYQRVRRTLAGQRQWEDQQGRPYPRPRYQEYEDK